MTMTTRILFYEGITLSQLRMELFCGNLPSQGNKIPGLYIRPLFYKGVNCQGDSFSVNGYQFDGYDLTPEANKIIAASFSPEYDHCNIIAYAMTYGSGFGGIVREMPWYMEKSKNSHRIEWYADTYFLKEYPYRIPTILKSRIASKNRLNQKQRTT